MEIDRVRRIKAICDRYGVPLAEVDCLAAGEGQVATRESLQRKCEWPSGHDTRV